MTERTYYLHSYGCQMNLADSGILSGALESVGFKAVPEPNQADVIIINTCSVREKAEERALGRLRELVSIKKSKNTLICAIGCMAQRYGQELTHKVPGLDFVLGTERLFELPQLIGSGNGAPVVDIRMDGGLGWAEYTPVSDSPYAAHVTITRGCNNFCAYCVVPYLRGRERHRDPDGILRDIRQLVDQGISEITLVGQNVNSYEIDGLDFTGLLRKVAGDTDIKRIRFITSHPKDIPDRLIDLFSSEEKMMPHLHLPLQSGSDRVLELMFRGYTWDHYRRKVEKLRKVREDIAITTDLIVGFPTETEDEFKMTLDAVREIRFDAAFMFRYSVREETWAAKNLKDDVPEAVKLDRLKRLINLQKEISALVNNGEIGLVRQVLVDGTSRRDAAVWKGKTGQNKTMLFQSNRDMLGKVVPVEVVSADSWTLHGKTV